MKQQNKHLDLHPNNRSSLIIEKQLGITGDYQYKAIRSKNYLQANWHNNKMFVMKQLLDTYKPETMLDLGTGSGNFELLFAHQLKKIVGVDYNDEALIFLESELTKNQIQNVQLVNQNILEIDKLERLGAFDMIILIDVIEHLDSKTSNKLVLSLKKLLNPHGKVVIITPNYGGIWPAIEKTVDRFTNIPHLEDIQHINKMNPSALQANFQAHNFKTINISTFNTLSFLFPGKFLSSFVCDLELKLSLPFGSLIMGVFEV